MKTKTRKYKICDYNHYPDQYSYINSDTKDPKDGWVSTVPTDNKEFNRLKEKPTPMKFFSTKSEAKEYLDVIKHHRNNDWDQNQHLYMVSGYKKPQWKVYEVNENT